MHLQRVQAEFAVDAYGLGYLDPSKDPSTEPDVRLALKILRRCDNAPNETHHCDTSPITLAGPIRAQCHDHGHCTARHHP